MGWQNRSFGGGGAFPMAAGGPDGRLWVTCDVSGAAYSDDDGATWTVLGENVGLNDMNLYAVFCDPDDSLRVYLGGEGGATKKGLLKTTDGGTTFTEVNVVGFVTCGAVAPSDHDRVYAAFHGSYNSLDPTIYKSTNRGTSFASAGTLPAGTRCLKLVVDPATPANLLAVTGNQKALISSSTLPQRLYASTNSGAAWTQKGPKPDTVNFAPVVDAAIDPNAPTTWYVTTVANGTWKSPDSGATWTQVSLQTGCVQVSAAPAALAATLYGTDAELADALDGTFLRYTTPVLAGLGVNQASDLVGASAMDDMTDVGDIHHLRFFARVRVDNPYDPLDAYVAEMTTPQLSWHDGTSAASVAVEDFPEDGWAWVDSGDRATAPSGGAWTRAKVNALNNVGAKCHFENADTDPWGPYYGALSVSRVRVEVYAFASRVVLIDPNAALDADKGAFVSQNGGLTWQHYTQPGGWVPGWKPLGAFGVYSDNRYGDCNVVGRDLKNPSRLLYTTDLFAYRSNDLGRTFVPLFTGSSGGKWYGTGLDNSIATCVSMVGDRLYLGTYDNGLWRSDDGGATWTQCSLGAFGWGDGHGGNVMSVCADPADPNTVLAAVSVEKTGPYTLIVSLDAGSTWTAATYGAGPVQGRLITGVFKSTVQVVPGSSGSPTYMWYAFVDGRMYYTTAGPSLTNGWYNGYAGLGLRVGVMGPDKVLYAGGEGGLYRSTDVHGLFISPVAMDTSKFVDQRIANPNMAVDAYMQWRGVHSLLINNGNVFATYYNAGTAGKGLYKSVDAGANWTLELADSYSRAVAADAAGVLFHSSSRAGSAGTNSSPGSTGVKKKAVGGSWASMMSGTAWPGCAWPLAVKSDGSLLVAGFPGLGLWTYPSP